jgi:PPOX class probable F420-dependent enzyme
VPVTFALVGDHVVSAVDEKPKRSQDLQRLRNIAATPQVSLLVDAYSEDWSQLWWVRLDGSAEIVADGPRRTELVQALVEKYPQYQAAPPPGPVIVMAVERHTAWSAHHERGSA